MPRIVYNRVGKAGSATMYLVLLELAKQNRFQFVLDEDYWRSKSSLTNILTALPEDSLYFNHCGYLPGLPKDEYIWINVVRNPIELEASYYYYKVSESRGPWGEIERKRAHEEPCGCPNMEFDDCYRSYIASGRCEDKMRFNHSAIRYFHAATDEAWLNERVGGFPTYRFVDGFTGEMAFARARDDYAFVGLTEELDLTIMALEKQFPRFFANASSVYQSLSQRGPRTNRTPEKNMYTHTEKNGAVSTFVKEALIRYNPDDILFYENVKRLFWLKIASLFPDIDLITVRRGD